MVKLAKREEQIMQVFWDLNKGFIRDVIPLLPDPKPHYNSVATIVKILEEKGFLDHETTGNMHCYFPVISREDYTHFGKRIWSCQPIHSAVGSGPSKLWLAT